MTRRCSGSGQTPATYQGSQADYCWCAQCGMEFSLEVTVMPDHDLSTADAERIQRRQLTAARLAALDAAAIIAGDGPVTVDGNELFAAVTEVLVYREAQPSPVERQALQLTLDMLRMTSLPSAHTAAEVIARLLTACGEGGGS